MSSPSDPSEVDLIALTAGKSKAPKRKTSFRPNPKRTPRRSDAASTSADTADNICDGNSQYLKDYDTQGSSMGAGLTALANAASDTASPSVTVRRTNSKDPCIHSTGGKSQESNYNTTNIFPTNTMDTMPPLEDASAIPLPPFQGNNAVAAQEPEMKTATLQAEVAAEEEPEKSQKATSAINITATPEKRKTSKSTRQRSTSTPRSARRKKGAALIQASDPAAQSTNGNTQAALVIPTKTKREPETTLSGQPRLKQFCSAYRCKPRQGAAAPAPPPPPPAPEEEIVTPAAPVVRLVDGKIVLQESSMEVSGNKTTHQQAIEEEFDVVEEEAQLGGIGSTYSSFRKQNRPLHWSVEETKKFYEALRQVGQDFGTMEFFFDNPRRNRKSLKQKFRQESNKNPKLIEAALNPKARQKIDLDVFSVEVDEAALKKSRKEREKAYEKTKQAHEERQRKEEEAAKKQAEHPQELEEPQVVVNRGFASQNSSLFDDTNQFWDEAAKHEGAEEVLGPLEMDDGGLTESSLTHGSVGISLSSSASNGRKKKKTSFRARKKKATPTK